jgi:hypothetical protein
MWEEFHYETNMTLRPLTEWRYATASTSCANHNSTKREWRSTNSLQQIDEVRSLSVWQGQGGGARWAYVCFPNFPISFTIWGWLSSRRICRIFRVERSWSLVGVLASDKFDCHEFMLLRVHFLSTSSLIPSPACDLPFARNTVAKSPSSQELWQVHTSPKLPYARREWTPLSNARVCEGGMLEPRRYVRSTSWA